MYGMFCTHHEALDNARYPDLKWTPLQDWIKRVPELVHLLKGVSSL